MPTLRQPCERCRHAFSFHGRGTSACQAVGCKAGPDGGVCPVFVDTVDLASSPS